MSVARKNPTAVVARIINMQKPTETDLFTETEHPLKFSPPFTLLNVGESSSGKSTLTFKLILNHRSMFDREIGLVCVFYAVYDPVYEKYREKLIQDGVEFRVFNDKSVLSVDFIEEVSAEFPEKEIIFVLDDTTELRESKSMETIAILVTLCRHRRVSFILNVHKLYLPSNSMRLIFSQANYLILFPPSLRLRGQISHLQRQLGLSFLLDAFDQAGAESDRSLRPLLLDLRPGTHPMLRVRSGIDRSEFQTAYIEA